jgi:hypothetical protein
MIAIDASMKDSLATEITEVTEIEILNRTFLCALCLLRVLCG